MRKATIFIVVGLLLTLCSAPVNAADLPPLPHAFYGDVTINNSLAPPGTRVEARGEGVEPGTYNPITTTETGKYGSADPLGAKLIVQGDIEKLRQVFSNIVQNAVYSLGLVNRARKFTVELSQDDSSVCVQFIDNGAGITADNIRKIWEMFFTTKKPEGRGIGLALVKRVIEVDHHGHIQVESYPLRRKDPSTRFTITLWKKRVDKGGKGR